MKKIKSMNISREDWVKLISLDKLHPINKEIGAKFICNEIIKESDNEVLYRLSFEDIQTHRLYCVKYIVFKTEEGKLDIAVNTKYTDKLYYI